MSRDSYGAMEPWEVWKVASKTRKAEYSSSRVSVPDVRRFHRSITVAAHSTPRWGWR